MNEKKAAEIVLTICRYVDVVIAPHVNSTLTERVMEIANRLCKHPLTSITQQSDEPSPRHGFWKCSDCGEFVTPVKFETGPKPAG